MKPYEAMGWSMINATAITALVTTTNIIHGLRPKNSDEPSINYYELSGLRFNGIENQPYSVNCRSTDPGIANDIAREVVALFNGSVQTGIYGTQNGFDFARAHTPDTGGLIPEPTDDLYNAPVTVTIVYPSSTVS